MDMHRLRLFALLSAAAVSLSAQAQQRRRVSLREALQLAAKQGPDVAAARAQARVTGEAEKVALRREEDAKAVINAGADVEIALVRAQTETAQARAQIASLQGQRESLFPLLEALTGEAIEPQPLGASQELSPLLEESAQ